MGQHFLFRRNQARLWLDFLAEVGLVHCGVCLTVTLHGLLHHRFGATAEVVLVPAAEVPATWP